MTDRSTGLMALVVLVGLLVLGAAGVCGYQAMATAAARRDTAAARHALTQAKRQATQRERTQAAGATLTTQVLPRPQAWGWSEELPQMMAHVTRLVKGTGADVQTMTPAPVAAKGGVTRFPLRVTMRADLQALTTVLERAQTSTPTLAVDQLSIRPGPQASDPLQVELTLSSFTLADAHAAKGGRDEQGK